MIRILIFTLIFIMPSIAYSKDNKIFNNINDAKIISREKQLPLIIIFSADYCQFCTQLKTEIIKQNLLNDYIICILDLEENKKWFSIYKVNTLPTSIMFDINNKEISKIIGYNKGLYLKWLGQQTK